MPKGGYASSFYAHGHPKEDASKSGGCPASRGKIFPYSIAQPRAEEYAAKAVHKKAEKGKYGIKTDRVR